MHKKQRSFWGGSGPYIVFALSLTAAGIIGANLLLPASAPVTEEKNPVMEMQEPDPVPTVKDTPIEIELPTEKAADTVSEQNTAADAAADTAGKKASVQENTVKIVTPITGETIAAFSAEELSYNEALNDWRTHNGIDIAAEEGSTVSAAADGTVESVSEDPLLGVMVVISHTDGYSSCYACLAPEVYVSAGDEVLAGQSIGSVGTTAAGESSEPHLHFSVSRNGTLIDPEEYLH